MMFLAVAALVSSLASGAAQMDASRKAQHGQQDAAAAAARQAEQAAALAASNDQTNNVATITAGTTQSDPATSALLARKRTQPGASSNVTMGV